MDDILSTAERLEVLLPQLMRSLFRLEESDPIGDLPVAQLRMLRAVQAQRGTVSDLAEALEISISAASQLIHRLAEINYVHVIADSEDRRQRMVELTDLSRSLLEDRRRARVNNVQQVLKQMTEDERKDLLLNFERLLESAKGGVSSPVSLGLTADIEKPLHLKPKP